MVTPANRTSGSMDLPDRPIHHDFDAALNRQGRSPALESNVPDKNKQRMFAAFEVLVGSTALAVGAASLHIALNPPPKEDEAEQSKGKGQGEGRGHGTSNIGDRKDKDITVKIIPIFMRERQNTSSRK